MLCVILSCRVKQVKPRWPVHPQQQSQKHQGCQGCSRKKAAMAELFGELFTTEERITKPLSCITEEEVTSYKVTVCDPLAWWKSNKHKYPRIAKLVRHYLAVPRTSVPSERVFSTAGDNVTASRSRLSVENVDKLIFLQRNMKIE